MGKGARYRGVRACVRLTASPAPARPPRPPHCSPVIPNPAEERVEAAAQRRQAALQALKSDTQARESGVASRYAQSLEDRKASASLLGTDRLAAAAGRRQEAEARGGAGGDTRSALDAATSLLEQRRQRARQLG